MGLDHSAGILVGGTAESELNRSADSVLRECGRQHASMVYSNGARWNQLLSRVLFEGWRVTVSM